MKGSQTFDCATQLTTFKPPKSQYLIGTDNLSSISDGLQVWIVRFKIADLK